MMTGIRLPGARTIAALFVLYFVAASASIGLTAEGSTIPFIWPAGPILVVFLFSAIRCQWLPLLATAALADLASSLMFGSTLPRALLVAALDVGEGLAIVMAVYSFKDNKPWFVSIRNIAVFSGAAILVPSIAAALVASGLVLLENGNFASNFRTWFVADALAYLIFTPFFLSWLEPTLRKEISRYAHVESLALTCVLAIACALSLTAEIPLTFVVFPLAMLLTIRSGLIGATVGPVTVAAVMLVLTSQGIGPIAAEALSSGERIQLIQFHVLAVSFTLFPAAAMLLRQRILSERADKQATIAGAAMDNMAQGLSMFDTDGRMVTCNRQYRQLYGLPEALCRRGAPIERIIAHQIDHGLWPGEFSEYGEIVSQKDTHQELEFHLLDGRVIKVHRRALADGTIVSTHEDVTEQRANAQKIAHMASHDPLTELANRRQFRDGLNSALARGERPFAVHTIDLDHFKEINDGLGHPTGDAVLKFVARQLREAVQPGDLVARLGGDEFAVLQLAMESSHEAADMAGRLARDLDTMIEVDGAEVRVTVSVGTAIASDGRLSADELMRMSDVGLYDAKSEGRSTYRVFEPAMDVTLRAKKRLEKELRLADHGRDFELYYQPIMDLPRGEVVSFEALIRWQHPTEGLILPGSFIEAAEESGAIKPIGHWALHSACQEAMKWPGDIKVAVNVSPLQLRDAAFLDSVISALRTAGLAPSRLQIEITESVLLHDTDDVLNVLAALRKFGVGISVDDFGTGYSSLRYLRKFPFDTLKIDQSFTRDLALDPESRAIVESTLGLAHKLGMTTVAEGVETLEQMRLLRAMNCHKVQGYLISRPRPASEVAAMLSRLPLEAKELNSASRWAA